MEKVDEVDHLKLTLAEANVANAQLQLQLVRSQVGAKYGFAAGDDYDRKTLEIKRAPKQEKASDGTR